MKEDLNSNLFRNAEEHIKKLTMAIKSAIKGTRWEGKVFLSGGTVRNLLLGAKNDGTYEIVVEQKGGGVAFATWLTKKINGKSSDSNPVINAEWGLGCFVLEIDDDIAGVTIEAIQTMREWPEAKSGPIGQLFGTLKEDAMSRDYTINALNYDISADTVIDKTGGGITDAACGILRTIKAPKYAFKASPARILRGLRLSAQTGFSFEKRTWLGLVSSSTLAKKCDKIDIRLEMNKILLSDKPSVTLNRMYTCGVLRQVFPDLYDLKDVTESFIANTNYLGHTFRVVDAVFPTIEHRLSALFHDVGQTVGDKCSNQEMDDFSSEYACDILEDLGYKKSLIETVAMAIQNHRFFSVYSDNTTPNTKRIKMFLELCGRDYPLVLDLMNAENRCSCKDPKPKQVLKVLTKIEEIEQKAKEEEDKIPVNGTDVMDMLNLKQGPIIGHIMTRLKRAFKKKEVSTKEDCLAFAQAEYDRIKDVL